MTNVPLLNYFCKITFAELHVLKYINTFINKGVNEL